MDKTYIYNLAYAFRNAKIWNQIYEEELFAVKLPSKSKKAAERDIAYCLIMGRGGTHMSLAVYVGPEAFTSYRKLAACQAEYMSSSMADILIQDCVQCSIEQRDQFDPQELDELRAFCKQARLPFRAPFPQFSRYYPHCMPWKVTKVSDWNAIGAALDVVTLLTMELKHSDKAALGLRPIALSLQGEAYGTEQPSLLDDPTHEDVTIPLYSIVDGKLAIERVSLPPFTEALPKTPRQFNDLSIARLMRGKQRGTFQCEVIRLPEPVDGNPPYVPAVLFTVGEDGLVLPPVAAKKPAYDPNKVLDEFISSLDNAYPRVIQVRTAETKALLEEFCRRARIRLEEKQALDILDDAVDDLMDHMGYGPEAYEEEGSGIEDTIEMLRAMTLEDLRSIPTTILDDLLENADLFPADVVRKLRKVREKRSK